MAKLFVAENPCESCPYRRDVPSGIWHESEYEKLRAYDSDGFDRPLAAFLCHHSPDMKQQAACRGWLTVHRETVAVRIAMMTGQVTPDEVYTEVSAPLFASGNEAADAGIKGVKRPKAKARKVIDRLLDKKMKRNG